MKIAIATDKGGLDDSVFPIFGRCTTFTIVEVEGEEIKDTQVVPNQFMDARGGAGIQTSQLLAGRGVDVVIAGNFGPNAFDVLKQAGVKVI